MKNLVVCLFAFALFSCGSGSGPSKEDIEKVNVLMKAEPRVKDHVFTEVRVLYVAVIDDGTSRNGYAEYMCQVLRDAKIEAFKVRVIKFGSQKDPKRDNAYGILLGEAQCN